MEAKRILKRCKIVATLGPSSSSPEMIRKLIQAGVNVFRLNFSHGKHPDHAERIANIRAAAKELNTVVGILQDIQGPKIRVGDVKNGEVLLTPGTEFFLSSAPVVADEHRASVTYENMEKDVPVGATILLDDGLLEMKVLENRPDGLRCEVVVGGPLKPNKGVNFPGVKMDVDVITAKDKEDLKFGVEHGVDLVAASFVQDPADVLMIRELLAGMGSRAKLIAKIERREAVETINDIVAVADGCMVARGDLGVETSPEEVPLAQKRIIAACNAAGKPVITATQMLDSMIHNPRPTRAEASDVANAVFDGTDAVMLSNETAAGAYPLEAVDTMVRIVMHAEEADMARRKPDRDLRPGAPLSDAISLATAQLADKLDAAAIITATVTGSSARAVSRYRPQSPIFALSMSDEITRQLALVWGVYPRCFEEARTDESLIDGALEAAKAEGLVSDGDLVVITAGTPLGVPGNTNFIKVEVASTVLAHGMGMGKRPATGPARVAKSAEEAIAKVQAGDILVVNGTDKDYVPAMRLAGGVICECGGLTSHAAIVCLQLGIPLLLESADLEKIPDGETITLDPNRGVVFKGKAKVWS